MIDEQGRALVRGTTCKVIELAGYHRFWKMDADSLHANLPHLSLAQIHAALSYYYDHQSELDRQMERNAEWADRLREEQGGNRSLGNNFSPASPTGTREPTTLHG